MRLLGFSCGRKMGNSEILVKEALMGAEELGVDIEILRLQDLEIKPCRLCKTCLWEQEGPEACVIKDDAAFFWDRIMECDGLILAAPVYSLTPPGYLLQVCDRALGAKADVGFSMERKKMRMQGAHVFVDERAFKTRVGAFISHGGSVTPNWLSFGLFLLHTRTFALNIKMVDQMQVAGAGILPGQVLLKEAAIERARKLGRRVAEAMGKPIDEVRWMGDEPGTCPVCHSNLLTVTKRNPVECPVCGISGEIRVDGDEITVTFNEEEQKRSRLTLAGKLEHYREYFPETDWEKKYELQQTSSIPKSMEKQLLDEIAKKKEKYKSYKSYSLPPRKAGKRSRV
jgi:multimeric flavodoxin WrbA/uncharacterized Zn finger protein (UPF0148 family)